ncbi:phage tail protein [Photorhabdus sp. RM71S]|uniref:phage tail protein n=1 Tax=Photorhabdus sp. RM71S TaxID=3342824 RepID=UPI0036DACE7E
MKNPNLIPMPFAKDGQKDDIPATHTSELANQKATWDVGFPPITMLPVTAGGLPPSGRDFNGILNQISENIVHLSKGGKFKFSTEYTEQIGGYSKGAILQSDDELKEYQSLIDNNKINFNIATQDQVNAAWKLVNTSSLIDNLNKKLNKSDVLQAVGQSTTQVMSQKAVTDALNTKQDKGDYATNTALKTVNDNANSKLAKNQNGADIPNKSEFVKNLGLVETVNKANNAVPSSRKVNGKALTGDISLNAGDVGAFPAAISVNSIPGRGFIGPFSGERGAYWAKGINIGQSSDVGQIYITANGLLYAYFLNSNGTVAGGAMGGCPVGVPLPYPHRYTPAGYLTCNGQSFNKSLYPKLAEAYPAGRVPDLRGEFIRGWDDSRGVDPGRVCGSWQGEGLVKHNHNYRDRYYIEALGSLHYANNKETTPTGYNGNTGSAGTDRDNNGFLYIDSTTSLAGGDETRPRNVAFNYIVRAA